MVPQAAAQERAPLPPFAYVGTVERGSERYAVLTKRGQSVLLVRAGETIDNEYRVQSIAGERLLLVNLASGRMQELVLALPGSYGVHAPGATQESAIETPSSASVPWVEGARPRYEH